VDVFQTLHNLEEDALDATVVETLVVASLHQLVQVALHVLHGDMELLGERVQEDVEGGNKVRVVWQCAEEDDFTKLQAWC
jgi:uncharacterized OB-fold protein